MTDDSAVRLRSPQLARLEGHRRKLEAIRAAARERLTPQATGAQIAGGIAQGFEELLLSLLDDALAASSDEQRRKIANGSAVVAIGGFGRGEMAPCSDVDLLFLYRLDVEPLFTPIAAQVVRDGWDTGLKMGHSVRSVRDALAASRADLHLATALTTARPIWGSAALAEDFLRRFRQQVARRREAFVAECIAARMQERRDAGGPVLQLEPDLKRSFGGLRDLHLIRWIGFAANGPGDLDSLRLQGELSSEETLQLTIAQDFLLNLRIELHLATGKPNDVLSRDQQLRIANERQIAGSAGRLPVEHFMQSYFEHSLAVADIANRFAARHRRGSWLSRLGQFLLTVRIDDIYRVGAGRLDVRRRSRAAVVRTLEGVLQTYLTCARYGVVPTDRLQQQIQKQFRPAPSHVAEVAKTSGSLGSASGLLASSTTGNAPVLSRQAGELFLQTLGSTGSLGALLRGMNSAGVLEAVLPAWSHARCLLQFNQYHSYTVDEHTLRTIEIVEQFDVDAGPLGLAYRELRHKEILHLALLLHDAGKGFAEDHSEVGRRLAIDAADRLGLSDASRELLVFLVHRHLLMADLAFRRDSSDPQVLLQFSHEVGSPETLKHLYVMTAADIAAVGPGVWTDWKAELLTKLYERTMEWLSGQGHQWEIAPRRRMIQRDVSALLSSDSDREKLDQHWDQFPDHYLLGTSPDRIAADFQIVATRDQTALHVEGSYELETGTVQFRVITHEDVVQGCFHKLTGVLTANRLEILSAAICTTLSGVIIDAYQVRDGDFADAVPQFRIDEVCTAIRKVLRGETEIERVMESRRRFGRQRYAGPVSNLPLRVVIDQDSSDRYTIIEVFAHDQPGLLYLIARTLFDLNFSVIRAQISTHFDQVVDGFYVTDSRGEKIANESRCNAIHDRLIAEITRLEEPRPNTMNLSAMPTALRGHDSPSNIESMPTQSRGHGTPN